MKKSTIVFVTIMLFVLQSSFAQISADTEIAKPFLMEGGIDFSVPVHIEMYRTHRIGIGVNFRAAKKISQKTELGIRAEYDYRFARNLPPDTTNTAKGRALHKNFSLIAVKPSVQFDFKSNWFFGMESGLGYAISDENNSIGLGFVSEYNGDRRIGSCSGLYIGKNFMMRKNNKPFEVSLNVKNFVAKGHAENNLELKFNYYFKNP